MCYCMPVLNVLSRALPEFLMAYEGRSLPPIEMFNHDTAFTWRASQDYNVMLYSFQVFIKRIPQPRWNHGVVLTLWRSL